MVRRGKGPRKVVRLIGALNPQGGLWLANPLNPALQNPSERAPASNSANLMLDEPPLIVRMRGLAGFMETPSSSCNPNEASLTQVEL